MQDVPKIVIERLPVAASADPHPEPDLLVAFTERTLSQPEREQVMTHLASCNLCREVVALAMPIDEVASCPLRASPGWASWPSLRWAFAGVGIFAVLAIAVLRFDQRQKQHEAAVSSPKTQVADSATQNSPSSSVVSESASAQNATQTPDPQRSLTSDANAVAEQHSVAASGRDSVSHEDIQTQSPATASNQTADALVQSHASSGSPYQSSSNTDVVKAKAADGIQAQTAPQPMPALPLRTSPSLMTRASPRWVVTADGGLQRSFDAGKTWETITIAGANASAVPVFRVVTAIGPEVWVGGLGAVLYHSGDSGNRWQQVPLSSGGSAASGDISRIEFSDPQNGKVATATGEIWITSDNGQTWQKLQ
jgi:hypothetical protein